MFSSRSLDRRRRRGDPSPGDAEWKLGWSVERIGAAPLYWVNDLRFRYMSAGVCRLIIILLLSKPKDQCDAVVTVTVHSKGVSSSTLKTGSPTGRLLIIVIHFLFPRDFPIIVKVECRTHWRFLVQQFRCTHHDLITGYRYSCPYLIQT